jgi:RNA recognition motif-containing protein
MNIHVSNLHLNVIEADLQRLFAPFGEIKSIEIVRDKLTNRSRRIAFIEMPIGKDAQKAILNLDGTSILGKAIIVTEIQYNPAFGSFIQH